MLSESGQVSPVMRTGVAPCCINWAFPRTFGTYWEPVSSQFPSSPALWLVQAAQSVLLLPRCVTLCFLQTEMELPVSILWSNLVSKVQGQSKPVERQENSLLHLP